MLLRSITLLVCVSVLSLGSLRAQSPNYTPQSPNAASLGRFGEQPVNYNTGIPSIAIPIYEIETGGVKLPISLNYHAGGIRVTDMASWVGLGWALSAGPTITRAVVGRPDENDGILNHPLATDLNNNLTPPEECQNDEFIYNQYFKGEYDTGYDLFTYSLPGGKTGQFILKQNTTITPATAVTLFPTERITITYSQVGTGILSFVVTDEDGTRYTFDQQENTTIFSTVAPIQAYNTTWYTSEIFYPKTDKKIQFSYTSTTITGYTDFINRIQVNTELSGTCVAVPLGVTSQTKEESYSVFDALQLSKITFPGGSLSCVTGATRTDVPGPYATPMLDRIDLYALTTSNTYQLLKKFDLVQSYYTADEGLGQLRLDALAMQDANGVEVGKYQCSYKVSMNMPGYLSHNRDTWGYYNGTTNDNTSSLIPYQPVTLNTGGTLSTIYIGEANRSSSETYMQVGVLTQLTYPTCGYSKFYYEANRYNDPITSTTALAGGLRIAKIETQSSSSEPVRVKTFRYGEGESGNGELNTNLSNANWSTSYVQYTAPDCGITIKEFTSYYNGVLTASDGNSVHYKEVAEYEGTSSQFNANGRTVYRFRLSNDLQYEVLASQGRRYTINYQWDRGQIESKTVYPQTGTTPVYQLANTWDRISAPPVFNIALQVANPTRYDAGWKEVNYPLPCIPLTGYQGPQFYAWSMATLRLKRADKYLNGSSTPTSTTFTYNGNYQVAKQELLATDGTIDVKEFRYPHDYTIPTSPSGPVKAIKILQDNNQRNTILEEYGYKMATSAETNPIMIYGKLNLLAEWTGLLNQAFIQQVQELQVFDGSVRKNSFSPMSIASASSLSTDSRYTTAVTFDSYDSDANPTQFTLRNGLKTKIDWLTLTGSSGNLFSAVQQETTNYGTANSLETQYTYEAPLIGFKSITDPKGTVTNYAYDLFGRLDAIRDQNLNLVQSFDYNYGCSPYNTKQLALSVPDLIPIMYAQPTPVYGTSNLTVVVDVFELNSVPTNGVIQVYINKDPLISLTFSPTATSVGGKSVTNSAWLFDASSSDNFYILTTTQSIPGVGKLSFGLTGVLTPGNTKGNVSISAAIPGGFGGGETSLFNNTDGDIIQYFQH